MAKKDYKRFGRFSDVRIGFVAELFDISDEALRKYEQNGLIFPDRSQDSQYRFYDYMDIVMMLYSRLYTGLGFSLKETSCLVNNCGIDQIKCAYEKQLEAKKRQLELLHKQLDFAEHLINDMERIPEMLGKCEFSMRPGIFRITLPFVEELLTKPKHCELLKQWISYLPFTMISTTYSREALNNRELSQKAYCAGSEGGLGILEQYASLFSVVADDIVRYYPPVPAIHTITHGNNQGLSPDFTPVYGFMENHHLRASDDAVSFGIVCNNFGNEFDRYCHLWVPYEKA